MTENSGTIEKYYVAIRPQTNEVHHVHKEGCPFMPAEGKRIYLGSFLSVIEAGSESRKYYSNSHGCCFCAKESSMVKVKHNKVFTFSEQTMLRYLN